MNIAIAAPPHQQLAAHLRAPIASGEITRQLPSLTALAADTGLSETGPEAVSAATG
jgi:DNA-binding transcriptional regulator YhcF (GntR family)